MPPDAPATAAPPAVQPSSSAIPELTSIPGGPTPPVSNYKETINRLPERLSAALRAKAKPTGTAPAPEPKEAPKPDKPAQPKTDGKPALDKQQQQTNAKPKDQSATDPDEATDTDTEPGEEGDTEDATSEEATAAKGTQGTDTKPPVKGKAWKLVEQYKERTRALERENAELRKSGTASTDTKETTERLTKAETRVKELEGELRLYNAEKFDPDFQKQYHRPYEQALARAFKDLQEVPVSDAEGNKRAVTMDDLMTIATSPLATARQLADKMFGEYAEDVLTARREIKSLWDARSSALDDLKKNGSETMRQREEQFRQAQEKVAKAVDAEWKKAESETITDAKYGAYFQPRENEPEWNQRLSKGQDLVERAFNGPSPYDPSLSDEARAKQIRLLNAVKHRAASWGAQRGEIERLRSELTEARKELENYKSAEPGTSGGTKKQTAAPQTGYTFNNLREALIKRAK